MATGSGEGDGKFKAQFPGDRATAPTPLEDASDDTWQEFVRLQTEPAPLSGGMGQQPAAQPAPAGAQQPITLETAMALARRSQRSCPKPAHWQRLHALLPSRRGAEPAPPIAEKDWKRTSSMQKRLVLRDHLEWAAATGVLPAVQALLESLAEDDWDHF